MHSADHTGYGLRNGTLQFIADVPSGLACSCVCAKCGQPLIAKKGPIRRHHFAHFEDTACHGAAESALHILAKELLAELDTFDVPQYTYTRQRRMKTGALVQHQAIVAMAGLITIDRVRVEKDEGDFVPDIVIESGTTRLIIEVAVTNRVARAKLRKLRRSNLPAIEIRLDPSDSFLQRDDLKAKLRQNSPSKVWLFHPDQRDAERAFASMYRLALAQSREKRAISLAQRHYPANRPAASRTTGHAPGWLEYERVGNAFKQKHGRYPSLEECRRFWPHLYEMNTR